ncbi:MAG: DUF1465 family protein [Proteobacteria bacterium]|nr:DUF1465 family protein [Pseudomonadota bacterium]
MLVCNGMEVSTDMGHILALGLREYVGGIRHAETLREVADDQGAFLVVAHPFRHYFDPVYFRRQGKEPFTLTPEQAAEPSNRLGGQEVCNGRNGEHIEALPGGLRDLLLRSRKLYQRIARLDEMIARDTEPLLR